MLPTQLFGSFAHFLQLPRGVVKLEILPQCTNRRKIDVPGGDVRKRKAKCLGMKPQLMKVVQGKVAASDTILWRPPTFRDF